MPCGISTVWSAWFGGQVQRCRWAGFSRFSLPNGARWADGVFGNYIVGLASSLLFLAVLVSIKRAGFWRDGLIVVRQPSREGAGLVVVTLGYGVNWAVFLSSQPELGDHRVLTFLLNPMNAHTGLAWRCSRPKIMLSFGWTPPAALRVNSGWRGAWYGWTGVILGGAKCALEP